MYRFWQILAALSLALPCLAQEDSADAVCGQHDGREEQGR